MQRPSASVRSADERALSTSCLATFTCSVAELPPEPELASRLRRILVDDGIEHVDARPSRSIRLSTGGALLLGRAPTISLIWEARSSSPPPSDGPSRVPGCSRRWSSLGAH